MIQFDTILWYIKEFIATIGVLVILIGTIRSIYYFSIFLLVHKHVSLNYIRLQFGNSIVLGLEFIVAGDIVGSLIQPDYYNLGLLAIIVLVRTFLSYFLNLELAALTPQQQQALK